MPKQEMILRKKNRDFLIPIVIALLEIFLFIAVCCVEVRHKIPPYSYIYDWSMKCLPMGMCDKKETGWNLVVAFCTISTAFVVFAYSMMDSKHLGITNRTIIRYRLGRFTVPLMFVISLLKLPGVLMASWSNWNFIFWVESVYIVFSQITVIFLILLSTSVNFCIYSIVREELWQYKRRAKVAEADRKYIETWKIPHVRHAMESGDVFSDKAALMWKILEAPIEHYIGYKKKIEILNKMETGLFMRCFTHFYCAYTLRPIRMENLGRRELKDFYDYYYDNLLSAFEALRDNKDEEERNKLYLFLYQFTSMHALPESKAGRGMEEKTDEVSYDMTCIIYGAIMNAAIVSGVDEAVDFCNNIINDMPGGTKWWQKQVGCYFLVFELIYRANLIRIENIKINGIHGIEDWKYDSEELGYDLQYWEMMVSKFSIKKERAKKYFGQAVQTLQKKKTISVAMRYILRQIGRGEVRYENSSD